MVMMNMQVVRRNTEEVLMIENAAGVGHVAAVVVTLHPEVKEGTDAIEDPLERGL